MYTTDTLQLKLLHNTKKFITSFNSSQYLPKKDNIFYLVSTSKSVEFFELKKLININSNFLKYSYEIIKDSLYGTYYLNNKCVKPKSNFTYKKIVVSWAFKKNFNKNGSYNDRYFNINSRKEKNTLWYLVYVDKKLPKKIDDNIAIFQPFKYKKANLKFGILNFINKLYLNLKNYKYFLTSISSHNTLAEILIKDFKNYLNKKVNYILMPFENQPFQNEIIQNSRDYNSKIKTIGYIHSPPLALPSNFIYKSGCPDTIVLNGADQYKCFTKRLGWNKKRVRILPSDRFLKKSLPLSNRIFLPLYISSKEHIIESLKFLTDKKLFNLSNFSIRNHPGATNSRVHHELIEEIKKIILKDKKKNKTKKNFSIFIGTSGAIIEALEMKLSVLQICENPIFDMYSSKIWGSIKKKKITDRIFVYSLKKKGSMIKLGKKSKSLNHYFVK